MHGNDVELKRPMKDVSNPETPMAERGEHGSKVIMVGEESFRLG